MKGSNHHGKLTALSKMAHHVFLENDVLLGSFIHKKCYDKISFEVKPFNLTIRLKSQQHISVFKISFIL